MMFEEAAFVGLFPNRQPRTGCAPGIHHVSIWPSFRTDPFQKIEDQGFNGVWHVRVSSPEGILIP